tara:strand:- start:19 stop:477 length:459 start_codon:yes stop_codon:yes gene_type:complete
MNNLAWDSYSPFNVGLDDIFNRLETMSSANTNYPPYNLVKVDSTTYEIEIALAGFTKEEIYVETETNVLKVYSMTSRGNSKKYEYLHHGLSKRAFTNSWQLGDDVKVSDVSYVDGLLKIKLEKIVPEHQRKIKYAINDATLPTQKEKVLLTE